MERGTALLGTEIAAQILPDGATADRRPDPAVTADLPADGRAFVIRHASSLKNRVPPIHR